MSSNTDMKLKFFMTFTRLDAELKVIKDVYTVEVPFLRYDKTSMMKLSLSGDCKNIPSPLPDGYDGNRKLFNSVLPNGITFTMARLIESETIHGLKYIFKSTHGEGQKWTIASDKNEKKNN